MKTVGLTDSPFARLLRTTAVPAILLGAGGSLALLYRAGHRQPSRLLIALFTAWVVGPFGVALVAHRASRHWSHASRQAVQLVVTLLALGSLLAYGYDAWRPRHTQAAFIFVVVPPLSVVLMALVGTGLAVARRQPPIDP